MANLYENIDASWIVGDNDPPQLDIEYAHTIETELTYDYKYSWPA